jgi:hypothetical protein
MGEMWVLKGRATGNETSPESTLGHLAWHIDAPGTSTSLDWRCDAVVVLALWSECQAAGGGTLVSPASLDSVVRALEDAPEGLDTRPPEWGWQLAGGIRDAVEMTGQPGDVLIAHALTLHAGPDNDSDTVSVLENPMITVGAPLEYHHDNPDPSPVERAVISRLRRRRSRPLDLPRAAARYLVERHDDYLLPGRRAFDARVRGDERSRVAAADTCALRAFLQSTCAEIGAVSSEPIARARAAMEVVRSLLVNQREVKGELTESAHDPDFEQTTFARLLRGFVNREGQNHLLGLLLVPFFPAVHPFEAVGPAAGRSPHTLTRVQSAEGWFFADAWSSHPLFTVGTMGAAHPHLPEHAQLERADDDGLVPRAHYEAGRLMPPLSWPAAPAVDFLREPIDDGPSSTWRDYLRVRARHVLEGARRTEPAYGEVLGKRSLRGTTEALVRVFAERHRAA